MKADLADNLLSGVPMPLVLIASNEYIEFANQPALELLGKGLSGRHYSTVMRQPDLHEAIETVFQTGQGRKARYQSTIGDQGALYNVKCVPVSGANAGVLVSFDDVTSQHEASQMRSDFVANVSHELRSPLTSLLGFIETLRGPAKDDEKARERFLTIMEREASRMTRLVRDLLSLTSVESEERVRPNSIVDIAQILDICIQTLKPMAVDADVEITFSGKPENVYGDADQLQQVFMNLIENSIKYGGMGGKVNVDVGRTQHEASLRSAAVRIAISDNGDGIEQIHIPRLTERFYRIDNHRSREMGGTGLGLAIVKHIVNRHRGRLKISSVKGQGSTFMVILPAA